MKKKYNVQGMTCAACAAHVNKAVNDIEGYSCNVSLLTNSMEVTSEDNIDDELVISAVQKAGYNASIYQNEYLNKQTKAVNGKTIRLIISVILMFILMYVAMGHMINILPDFLTGNNTYINVIIQIVLALIVMGLNYHYFTSGFYKLFRLKPNMDTLVALGSLISFAYSCVAAVLIFIRTKNGNFDSVHNLHHNHLYFDSSAMILTLVSVGKLLEGLSKKKTTKALDELMEMVPNSVLKVDGEISSLVSIESIKLNDVIEIRPYDVVPLDGIVVKGQSYIDDSSLTGESLLKEKGVGDEIVSGSKNQESTLYIKVTKTSENSTINQIIKMVEEASSSKMAIEKIVDKVALIFVPLVILISGIVFFTWLLINPHNINQAVKFGISVLVISCPCALGLATPLCVMVATLKASKNYILIKDAEVFEKLAKIDTIMFDKTGTITKGKLEITENTIDEKEYVHLQNIEKLSNHPLSKSIVENLTYNEDVSDFTTIAGKGISGKINGVTYHAGNNVYLKEILDIEESDLLTTIHFFTDKKYLGKVTFSDSPKPSSLKALELFKKHNVKTLLLTGDNENSTKQTCADFPIDEIHSSLLPMDKANIVKEYQDAGHHVLMIGDGINDSVALESAYIGIAMNETNIAKSSADVILTRSDLLDAYNAYHLAKKTVNNIKINLFWAFIYNIIAIPVAAGAFYALNFTLNPMIGALCMSLSSVSVCLNALRLNLTKMEYIKEEPNMTFYVKDMMCNHCVMHVEKALTKEGIQSVKVDLKTKKVEVETSLSKEEIFDLIKEAGYQPTDN
ncbi:MAG: cadmium-translocating P-type ATPase [Bacilli bacterium]|nr:cadmium-translocating P-type ATPase [Bacilli bacterium]